MIDPTMIDPTQIKPWVEGSKALLDFLKTAVGMLPSGKKKQEAERLLVQAENQQKQAEAALALKLGFRLCEYCWPPEIVLLSPERKHLECRQCHRPPLWVERAEAFTEALGSAGLNHNLEGSTRLPPEAEAMLQQFANAANGATAYSAAQGTLSKAKLDYFLDELEKREFIDSGSISVEGSPFLFYATPKGREYLHNLGLL